MIGSARPQLLVTAELVDGSFAEEGSAADDANAVADLLDLRLRWLERSTVRRPRPSSRMKLRISAIPAGSIPFVGSRHE